MDSPPDRPRRRRVVVSIEVRTAAALLLVAALVAASLWTARRPLVDLLAEALTVEDPLPGRAEAVFVHGGGLLVRVPGAVGMARAVGAETIVVTAESPPGAALAARYGWDPPTEVDAARRILEAEGWDGDFVVLGASLSTRDDSERLRDWCRARGVRSVVAVTSPPHARRARWSHARATAGTGIDVRVRTAMTNGEFRSIWPDESDHVQFVVMEALRLAAYVLRF